MDENLTEVYFASACFPGTTHLEAARALAGAQSCAALACGYPMSPSLKKMQLCPQHRGRLTIERCEELMRLFPGTEFRPHANVFAGEHFEIWDASKGQGSPAFCGWRAALGEICGLFGCQEFSWHAGTGNSAGDLRKSLDNTLRLSDALGCRVGIEGLYPSRANLEHINLLSSFADYAFLLESKVPYALDLSHWKIIARHEGKPESGLLLELLDSEACMEVHISDNDGFRDTHSAFGSEPFWKSVLDRRRGSAPVFCESNMAKALTQGRGIISA